MNFVRSVFAKGQTRNGAKNLVQERIVRCLDVPVFKGIPGQVRAVTMEYRANIRPSLIRCLMKEKL